MRTKIAILLLIVAVAATVAGFTVRNSIEHSKESASTKLILLLGDAVDSGDSRAAHALIIDYNFSLEKEQERNPDLFSEAYDMIFKNIPTQELGELLQERDGAVYAALHRLLILDEESGIDAMVLSAYLGPGRLPAVDYLHPVLRSTRAGDGLKLSPVMAATYFQNLELLGYLLQSGHDPNVCVANRATPPTALGISMMSGPEYVQVLLDNGANPDLICPGYLLPEQYLRSYNEQGIVSDDYVEQITRLLRMPRPE